MFFQASSARKSKKSKKQFHSAQGAGNYAVRKFLRLIRELPSRMRYCRGVRVPGYLQNVEWLYGYERGSS